MGGHDRRAVRPHAGTAELEAANAVLGEDESMVSVQRAVELKVAASDDFVPPDLSRSRRRPSRGPTGEVWLGGREGLQIPRDRAEDRQRRHQPRAFAQAACRWAAPRLVCLHGVQSWQSSRQRSQRIGAATESVPQIIYRQERTPVAATSHGRMLADGIEPIPIWRADSTSRHSDRILSTVRRPPVSSRAMVYGHARRPRRPGTNTVFVIASQVPPSGRWTVDRV